jgi:hypothetical protein
MAGKPNRPRRMNSPTKTWNILFPASMINEVREKAEEIHVSPAGLVRKAVENFLNVSSSDSAQAATLQKHPQKTGDFQRGVDTAVKILRKEVSAPVFPSGQTLGDRLAQKILMKIGEG